MILGTDLSQIKKCGLTYALGYGLVSILEMWPDMISIGFRLTLLLIISSCLL
jgi:hypothetical protein